ncbi:MAG: hypothetical protein U0N64_03845 [Blautia caecimuris]|jgi:hypothetical protein|nr:hypothetical protein [Blautia caecimuris]MBS5121841.1 hypothetical protein [Blautia sp.]
MKHIKDKDFDGYSDLSEKWPVMDGCITVAGKRIRRKKRKKEIEEEKKW